MSFIAVIKVEKKIFLGLCFLAIPRLTRSSRSALCSAPQTKENGQKVFSLFQKQLFIRFATVLLHDGGFCNGCTQNGFCSYKLSIHKKNNIMQIKTKNIPIFIYLIFYHGETVKVDHFMILSLIFANTVL